MAFLPTSGGGCRPVAESSRTACVPILLKRSGPWYSANVTRTGLPLIDERPERTALRYRRDGKDLKEEDQMIAAAAGPVGRDSTWSSQGRKADKAEML